jgi:tetratricopeptide (TPR) repeat protein
MAHPDGHCCTAMIQSGHETPQNLESSHCLHLPGQCLLWQGPNDRAIEDYDQAIRLNPNCAEAFSNRGIAYGSKGQPDRAIEDYDRRPLDGRSSQTRCRELACGVAAFRGRSTCRSD